MAGIQRHQEDNKGYGLIVSDEGQMLPSIIFIFYIYYILFSSELNFIGL